MIKSFDKNCTGCGACIQKCPQKAIDFKYYELGFTYPVIDTTKCINCNLCSKVCPINKSFDSSDNQKIYAAIISQKDILLNSTSGGIFSAICNWIFKQEGIVYGCAYSNELKPIHIRVDNANDLDKLRGSKYVQSNTSTTFIQAKKDLDSGKYVLYSGTPCQIDGLKKFLGKKYDKLLCVDIICHGVPSEKYFLDYIKYLENKYSAKISKISFRDKSNKGWSLAGTFSGTYLKKEKSFTKKLNYFDSYYYSYFLYGDIYRKSCYECKYAQTSRVGDITLGDFWGAAELKFNFNVDDGCSLVLLNSEFAFKIWNELDIKFKEISIEKAVMCNEQLRTPSKYRISRKTRIEEYNNGNIFAISNNFRKENFKKNIAAKIKYMLPRSFKKILLKIKYKNR